MADIDELAKLLGPALAKAGDTPQQKKLALEKFAQEKEGSKLHRLNANEQKKLTVAIKKQGIEYKELGKDLKEIQERFSELDDSLRSVRSSLRTFGSAAYSGTGSISDFTESLRGSSTILNFVADLGKTFDVNAETFRGLAEVGANFNQSVVSMRNAAASAALPLDDFAKLVRDNSTTLAALYGSTTKGAMGIAGLSEALRTEATPELASLGFTVDEINETLLTNMDRQRRTGIFDQLTAGQRVQSAKDFAMELDRLAKLTGQQRSELRAQLEQQASNARFAAFIRKQDDTTSRRLSGFSATISSVAPLMSEGMQDIIANAGRPVTDAGLQLIQNIPELQGTIQNLIAGTISSEQALMSMKDMSTKSLDRFSKAAVTGTVPFLDLTPGLVTLSTLTLDHVAAMKEQAAGMAGGTSSLMQFQENAKRLSAATQSLETGFYSMLGALGGEGTDSVVSSIGEMSDNFVKGTSDFTKAMLYGSKTIAGLGLNLLKNTLPTYMAVYRGTRDGNIAGGGMFGTLGKKAGGFAKGGARMAGSVLPWVGALGTAGMSVKGLTDDDKSNDASSKGGLIGTFIGGAIGGALGFFGGAGVGTVPGALYGATLGNLAGAAIGGMFDGRPVGTMSSTGQRFEPESKLLNIHKGETVLNQGEAKTFANLNFDGMEKQLAAISSNIVAANKIHNSTLESLNTSNMINNKTRIASELTARKRYEIGNV